MSHRTVRIKASGICGHVLGTYMRDVRLVTGPDGHATHVEVRKALVVQVYDVDSRGNVYGSERVVVLETEVEFLS
jgi:hypothetical protein